MAHKKKSLSQPGSRPHGDQNVIRGNISGGVITQGRNARVNVQQHSGMQAGELNSLFKELYQHIEACPLSPTSIKRK